MNMVQTKNYKEPSWDLKEILRYMGCKDSSEEINNMISQCISEIKEKLSYKVVFTTLKKEEIYRFSTDCIQDNNKNLPFGSESLAKNLQNCEYIILFASTIGIEADRLISKYSRLSPAKALCFQGFAAEPRFSPGYGDFPLSAQKIIFDLLDCSRKIGLSLNESKIVNI